MGSETLDRIHIRDLLIRCVVGVYEEERRDARDVILNLTLHADLRAACRSDALEETLDYKAIKKRLKVRLEASSFFLVERLAQEAADLCLEDERVRRVEVTVDKPGALRFARSVAVSLVREREP